MSARILADADGNLWASAQRDHTEISSEYPNYKPPFIEPMIVKVWRQAMRASLGPVLVAAAEPEIALAVERIGGRAVLTDPGLASGSDRVHAALMAADPDSLFDAVVNLQGDLPEIDPQALRLVADVLQTSGADIATLAAPIADARDFDNPNVVKPVVAWNRTGMSGRALYFTRATAPSGEGPLYHHIGLYAYRRDALARFVRLPPSPLERREKLEQLRALEAGMRIDAMVVASVPLGVDTPDDLEAARRALGGR